MWWLILLSAAALCIIKYCKEKKLAVWKKFLLPINIIFTCLTAFMVIMAGNSALLVLNGSTAGVSKAVYIGLCLCIIALFLFSCIGDWKYYFKMKKEAE